MPPLIEIALFAFLIATALGIARLRHLFAVVMLSGVFSLLSALLLLSMDAADVAFTEAAVGAGIATILMLGAMALTERREKLPARPWLSRLPSLLLACALGGLLLYAMTDAPPFGDPLAPAQQHLAPYYIAATKSEIGVPNLVTAILASYRGFDTLGEVVVIFTAGVGVAMLLAAGTTGSTAPTAATPPQNTPSPTGGREGVLGNEKERVARTNPPHPLRAGAASFAPDAPASPGQKRQANGQGKGNGGTPPPLSPNITPRESAASFVQRTPRDSAACRRGKFFGTSTQTGTAKKGGWAGKFMGGVGGFAPHMQNANSKESIPLKAQRIPHGALSDRLALQCTNVGVGGFAHHMQSTSHEERSPHEGAPTGAKGAV